jgi:hypothetical protein
MHLSMSKDTGMLFAAANKTGGFVDMDILVSGKHTDWLPAIGGEEPAPPPPPPPPAPASFKGGKGLYVWLPKNIGTPEEVADALVQSKTDFVAIKIHDAGVVYQGLEPYFEAIRAKGIACGDWGYVYLKWNASAEAKGALAAIDQYKPDFYLIDAEAEALLQFVPATIFAKALRDGRPNLPIGLSSYWKPTWHGDLPWKQLRSICNFDAPQVYWRGQDPVGKLSTSKAEFAAMSPKLPFLMPGGDMFYEAGIKPTPQQVLDFLAAAQKDGEITSVVFWSLDQKKIVPELWDAYSSFSWEDGSVEPPGPEPDPVPVPLYIAVTTASAGLRVRREPNTCADILDALPQGSRIEVWKEMCDWVAIDEDETQWVSKTYIKKV